MQDSGSYWTSLARSRFSRRRLLKTSAAAGSAAAILGLVGCGSGKSSTENASNLLYTPADTTNKAVKGGTLVLPLDRDIQAFNSGNGTDAAQAMHAYSRVVRYETYKYPNKALPTVSPDAAASWETSPDGLTWTYKLRPNLKFDPRAPTSGRAMNAQDVAYSWKYFEATSSMRSSLANSVDKSAPIVSITPVNDSTFTIKLAFPYGPINALLAYQRYMPIYPVEAESKYDVRNDMRGTSGWRLKDYQRSARIEYEKNPDWYDADKNALDRIVYPIIPEYTATLAQFRAGNLATMGAGSGGTAASIHQEDVLPTKRDLPQILMRPQTDFALSKQWIRFSYLPNSPFLDERVRRASSMLLDRDLIIETMGNTKQFTDAGLHAPVRWFTSIPAGEDGFWLDPKDEKKFGENAKFFKYDPQAAKQLIKAAGYNSGIESIFSYTPNGYDSAYVKEAQIMHQMWESNGDFKLRINTPDYQSDWRPNWHYNYDKHEGIAWGGTQAYPDIDGWLNSYWRTGLDRTGHIDSNGKPDAHLDDLIDKQRFETDFQKRTDILHEFQRYAAGKMYLMFGSGSSLGFDMAWPWLQNWGVFQTRAGGSVANEVFTTYWIDSKKG